MERPCFPASPAGTVAVRCGEMPQPLEQVFVCRLSVDRLRIWNSLVALLYLLL